MRRLAQFLWRDVPAAAARVSPFAGRVLGDGAYLTAWPAVAVALPAAALAAGFAVGAWRPLSDQLFTYFFAWPAILLGLGSLGGGVGVWAWLGFVVGDFVVFPHVMYELQPLDRFLREQLPILIVDEVLLGLVVLSPLAVATLPDSVLRPLAGRLRPGVQLGARLVLAALVAAFTAASWAVSARVLIRPVGTFHGTILQPQAVQGLDAGLWPLAGVAVAGAVLRVLLAGMAERPGLHPVRAPVRAAAGPRGTVVRAVIGGTLVGVGLAGLADTPSDVPILVAAAVVAGLLRSSVLPRLRGYALVIGRVPALLRVFAISVLGYLVGRSLLDASSLGGALQTSFQPVLLTAVVALIVGAVLLPGPPSPRPSQASAGTP